MNIFSIGRKLQNVAIAGLLPFFWMLFIYLSNFYLSESHSVLSIKLLSSLAFIYSTTSGAAEIFYKSNSAKKIRKQISLIRIIIFCFSFACSILYFKIDEAYISLFFVSIFPLMLQFSDDYKYMKINRWNVLLYSKILSAFVSISFLSIFVFYFKSEDIIYYSIMTGQLMGILFLIRYGNIKFIGCFQIPYRENFLNFA